MYLSFPTESLSPQPYFDHGACVCVFRFHYKHILGKFVYFPESYRRHIRSYAPVGHTYTLHRAQPAYIYSLMLWRLRASYNQNHIEMYLYTRVRYMRNVHRQRVPNRSFGKYARGNGWRRGRKGLDKEGFSRSTIISAFAYILSRGLFQALRLVGQTTYRRIIHTYVYIHHSLLIILFWISEKKIKK